MIEVEDPLAPVESPIKLKADLPYFNKTACGTALDGKGHLRITDGQICAGGQKNVDACAGDSGGPLMYYDLDKLRWVLSGIVSWGLDNCGKAGVPGVYTDVKYFMKWIRDTIETM